MSEHLPSPERRRLLAMCAALPLATLPPAAFARDPGTYVDPALRGEWLPTDTLLADLPRLMQALAVPALAVAMVADGEVAWSRTWGVLRAGHPTKVDARTLFEAASLSKPVFAYLVLQLADDGALELDRPLVSYLRPDYLSEDPRIDAITVRDVLRHSTGLVNWREKPATEKLAPQVAPGTRVDYSGEAFFWLQLAVEHVSGKSLDALAQERLFGPAGMHDSTYAWSADADARSVYGHAAPGTDAAAPKQFFRDTWHAAQPVADAWGKPLEDWTWVDATRALPEVARRAPAGTVTWPGDVMANAAASLRTTATDYARFLRLCMRRPQRAGWELREVTRMAMLTPQLPLPGRWSQKTLGWNVEDTRVGPVFFHSGSNGDAFKTFALGDAARRRGLVVFTNSGGGNLLYRRIVRDATGLDLLAFDL